MADGIVEGADCGTGTDFAEVDAGLVATLFCETVLQTIAGALPAPSAGVEDGYSHREESGGPQEVQEEEGHA